MTPTAQYDSSKGDGSGFSGGYWYGDTSINAFSILHLSGTGCWANGGYLNVMPQLAGDAGTPASFNHANETAQAGYYGVTLGNGIKAELTTTVRTGFARFTYPALAQGQQATIAIDPTVLNNRAQGTTADTIRRPRVVGHDRGRRAAGPGMRCPSTTRNSASRSRRSRRCRTTARWP